MAALCPSLLYLLPVGVSPWSGLVGGPQSVFRLFSEEVVPREAVNPLCPQEEQIPPPAMPSS